MANPIDPIELAHKIAAIASESHDPDTGLALIDLADQLLTMAGLPPAHHSAGQIHLGSHSVGPAGRPDKRHRH